MHNSTCHKQLISPSVSDCLHTGLNTTFLSHNSFNNSSKKSQKMLLKWPKNARKLTLKKGLYETKVGKKDYCAHLLKCRKCKHWREKTIASHSGLSWSFLSHDFRPIFGHFRVTFWAILVIFSHCIMRQKWTIKTTVQKRDIF